MIHIRLSFRNIVTTILLAVSCLGAGCKNRPGLAIVIDPASHREAQTELNAYIQALEERQGYHVYTIVDHWGIPDSIRACLQRLYGQKNDALVGAVFVGNIPIPMVRDAQHLTSAFKMNQRMDWKESSVPSDRFYDDFGLQFRFLRQDSTESNYFYYSLTGNGRQTLRPNIFSGRIRPTDTAGGSSAYEKLRMFLRKATAAKYAPAPIEHLFIYTGSGSLNESKVAHTDEVRTVYEHFPQLRNKPLAVRCLDYADDTLPKVRMMNELMRPNLDLAILHHHGDYDTQYLAPDGPDSTSLRKARLTLGDFAAYGFRPNCRVVLLDACYNASFHRDDCIANEYVFQPGTTIATIGGTVNMLQDRWPDKLLGLLAEGVPIGLLNQYNADLETHVVGDPTFAFASGKALSEQDFQTNPSNPKQWVKWLEKNTNPDCRNWAMEQLAEDTVRLTDPMLLQTLTTAEAGTERLQAFQILLKRRSKLLPQALERAANDNYELVQRMAVNVLPHRGDEAAMKTLCRVIAGRMPSARIDFNSEQGIQFFDSLAFLPALNAALDSLCPYMADGPEARAQLLKKARHYCNRWDEDILKLCEGKLNEKRALMQAGFMRIYLPPFWIEKVTEYTRTCPFPSVQRALLEALGWHRQAYNAHVAQQMATELSRRTNLPDEIRDEALKTSKRLTNPL